MSLRPEQTAQAIALLEKIALFAGATEAQRQAIAAQLDAKNFAASKVVLMDQEISKTVYLVSRGAVGIWRRVNNQKERIALLRAPDFFGESSMFSESPVNAMVKTEEPSELFLLPRDRFVPLLSNDQALMTLLQRNIDTLKILRQPAPKPSKE